MYNKKPIEPLTGDDIVDALAAVPDMVKTWAVDKLFLLDDWVNSKKTALITKIPICPESPLYSQRAVITALCGGVVLGYVVHKYVEPWVIQRYRALRAAVSRLRLAFLETRIKLEKWWSPVKETPRKFERSMVDARKVRDGLDDGDIVCLFFDGSVYKIEQHSTMTPKGSPRLTRKNSGRPNSGRFAEGRVIENCKEALASFTVASSQADFDKAAAAFVSGDQRTRYALALRALARERRPCVAIVRLVRRPAEACEPPRAGDLIIIWVPTEFDPSRSILHRTATTPMVVNNLHDTLTHHKALAPYTLRVEANAAVDQPHEPLDYDLVYKKLFQQSRVL